MKIKCFLSFVFMFLSLFGVQAKPQFGKASLFNDNWRFSLSDIKNGALPDFNDKKWKQVYLPHDWSVEGVYSPDKASATGYLPGGIGWYHKTFTVPDQEKGNKIYIYFEGVYNQSEVFINGHSVGKRPNGYISFCYDLTPFVKFGEDNLISVRVDHSKEVDSRWYTGSGIYRDVYLVYASPVHIDLWGVYFKAENISRKKADVLVETTIVNQSSVPAKVKISHEIVNLANGVIVAKGNLNLTVNAGLNEISKQNIILASPKFWSLENPYLYSLKTTVIQNGKVIDQNEQKLGIRELTFDANKGFALNGVWTKVKGVCLHHDGGCLGSAVPREVWERRLQTLKQMGCNGIRMSHNPQAPDVYELCDEIGLLVMDEAFDEWEYSKKKWITGWNIGVPGFQGSASFFEEWSDRDLHDMVMRDRNHPSIIMWSIGNEVDYPNDPYSHPILDRANINQPVQGGYLPDHPKAERLGVIAKRLTAIVRKLDTSRPVTAALAGVIMSNETDYPFQLDITGYNYTEERYAEDHLKYPKRVIYGSENGHTMQAWKTVRDTPYIFGQFLWTGIDYLGESGAWPSRGFNSGLIDFGGFLKPRGHFREALWREKPVAYLGTYPVPVKKNFLSTDAWPIWNYRSDELIRVVCYTNAAKAQLLLNGVKVGEVQNYDDNTGIMHWDLPYKEGTLSVVGMDRNNKELCTSFIQTSGRPHAIKAKSDVTSISKARGLAQVEIQVVDDKGIPVLISDDEITCIIDGPAQLLGLEASNNSDMGDYNDAVQRVYHGRLMAYIQSIGSEGVIKLKFSAPWLKEAVVILKSVQ